MKRTVLAKKKSAAKKKTSNRRWVFLLWLLILSPLVGILLLLGAAALSDLPDFNSLENPKSDLATEIMTTDGKVLGKYFKQNRTNVSYEEISPYVFEALVSTEDERYYEHSGIDIEAVTRAIAYMGKRGGGSTITQQLAKLLFTRRDKEQARSNKVYTIFQKAKEWIIAMRLEKSYTKQEILAMYLNQYDFLNQAVGIRSASNIYFDKEPIALDINESAMLVGMLKNSALFNPLKRPERVHKRREVVLSQMKRNEMLDAATYDSLRVLPLGLKYTRQAHDEGLAPYFREILRGELKDLLNTEDTNGKLKYANPETGKAYDLYSDGLKIYTTIDSRLQQYAENGVRAHMKNQLQGQFSKFVNGLRNPPFSNDLSKAEVDRILETAKKRSFYYRILSGQLCGTCERTGMEEVKVDGISQYVCTHEGCGRTAPKRTEAEIDKIFNTPREMEVFSYKGMLDTVLSPMDSIRYYKSFLQAGLMSMDPRTGFVKAWVGGIDFKEFKYDHVKQGKRQVGSTFKPIIYATAIREGMSPCQEIPKVPTTFEKGTFNLDKDWTPQDSDHDYGYMATINWGLSNSINTMTAYVMKQFGPDPVVKLARDMGITSDLIPVPSLCLGVADLSVYEITAANSVFANQGVYIEPIIITRIEDKSGNSIYDVMPNTREALDPRTAAIMIEMMKGTVDGVYNKHKDRSTGTAMRLRMDLDSRKYDGFPRDIKIACKTGTTQNQSDGWFIGMVPELATGIWVGAEDRGVRFESLQLGMGTNMALPIWGYYMKEAYADKTLGLQHKDFERAEGVYIDDVMDCQSIRDADPFNYENGGESLWD